MSVPVISAQTPANLSTGNSLRPVVSFNLDSDNGINPTSVQVYLNGALAYDGSDGGYQSGHYVASLDWTTYGGGDGGFVFSPSSPNLNAYLVPYDVFLPDSTTIAVRVVARDNVTGDQLDTTWHFDTATTPQNARLTNLANVNYVQALGGVMTWYDPFRFDLTVDPIGGRVIDPTQVALHGTFFGSIIAGGAFQAGYTGTVTAIPGGYRYEVAADPTPWSIGLSDTLTLEYAGDGGFTEAFSFNTYEPLTSNPGIGGNVYPDFTAPVIGPAYGDLTSGLAPPVYDEIHLQRNSDPTLFIYDHGTWLAGWSGSFTPGDTGPILDAVHGTQQGQHAFITPPVGYFSDGDFAQFSVIGHVDSPTSGTDFTTLSLNWGWNIIAFPPPAGYGKRYAVETRDPRTIVLRTHVDGDVADCDFNLTIDSLGVKGDV